METHDRMYCALRVDGVDCPVTNLFDIDGIELDDEDTIDMACVAVVLLPNGKWMSTEIGIADLRALN